MRKLLVWDVDGPCKFEGYDVVYWKGTSKDESSSSTSLPDYIEDNAHKVREKYLDWVYSLEEIQFGGKRLPEFFNTYLGLNYWFLMPIVEKCNFYKSTHINNAVGLIGFEMLVGKDIDVLCVASGNTRLRESLSRWAEINSIQFKVVDSPVPCKSEDRIKTFLTILPYPLRAILWTLHYLSRRWSLGGVGIEAWKAGQASTTFFSYMFGFKKSTEDSGQLKNPYWGNLFSRMDDANIESRWVHILQEDAFISSAKDAKKCIHQLNKEDIGKRTHILLDSFLSLGVVYEAMKRWFLLLVIARSINRCMDNSKITNPVLWPLFRDEWRNSIAGEVAMKALLTYGLFEKCLSSMGQQKLGIFLQENQGWERGLIFLWKKFNHGKLIGFPHTVVRFWDLRYFFSKSAYRDRRVISLPIPDFVAISGNVSEKEYLAGHYPAKFLKKVEALRYLHLFNAKNLRSAKHIKFNCVRLLVLGDYDRKTFAMQMRILEGAIDQFNVAVNIYVKPHPKVALDSKTFDFQFNFKNDPIENLLADCDVVYVGAVTSAAVDAYCSGIPIMSLKTSDVVSLSPLRGLNGVRFISCSKDLSDAINSLESCRLNAEINSQFFFLDPELNLWLSLLK